eukprot:TRINITY_DN1881_c0_g2_i4.p1 TRINITY_DN1881_c0_g2~~TRINITY_DN1881_c0_g2_i4.p1  ORF type:complete len:723 (+),score=152.18 TRINITY_DN1881_c0_g2_i4:94-2262(+)
MDPKECYNAVPLNPPWMSKRLLPATDPAISKCDVLDERQELLEAQHAALLNVLEAWLVSQEERLSRLFISYATSSSCLQSSEQNGAEAAVLPTVLSPPPAAIIHMPPGGSTPRQLVDSASTASVLGKSAASSSEAQDDEGETSTTRGALVRRKASSGALVSQMLQDESEAKEAAGRKLCKAIVAHPAFEAYFAILIILNAVVACAEVQLTLEDPHRPLPALLKPLAHLLGIHFVVELFLRLGAAGSLKGYLSGPNYGWNYFDLVLVGTWCIEACLEALQTLTDSSFSANATGLSNMRLFRVLRITRIIRLLRVARILRFVRALNLLVLSIVITLRSLVWASVLLLIIIFTFAIFICQSVADTLRDCDDCVMDSKLKLYWGSLPAASLSLFQVITNGKDWDDLARPLMEQGGFLLIILIVFIIFSQFAVLNVVTGVFCQAAVEGSQRDRELMVQNMVNNKQRFVDALGEQFANMFRQLGDGGLNMEAFEEHLHAKSVREYFAMLELDTSDAWTLFRLLDVDHSGCIDVEEFVDGCLRLKGTARSIDLARLSMELKHTYLKISDEVMTVKGHVRDVQKALDAEKAAGCGTYSKLSDEIMSVKGHVRAVQKALDAKGVDVEVAGCGTYSKLSDEVMTEKRHVRDLQKALYAKGVDVEVAGCGTYSKISGEVMTVNPKGHVRDMQKALSAKGVTVAGCGSELLPVLCAEGYMPADSRGGVTGMCSV